MMKRTGATWAVALILGLAALPSAAQQVEICPGIGAGAWIGGDAAASDVSTAAGPLDAVDQTVPPRGQVVSAFEVSAEGEYRVEALPDFGGDTVIELYNSDGGLVLTDDDSGGNLIGMIRTVGLNVPLAVDP